MKLDALDYELPEELIAATPPPERDGGRMMVVNRRTGAITHAGVRDLARYVPDRAALVVNDTRVIPARLYGHRETGGKVELLLVRALDATATRWKAMGRASKPLRPGTTVRIANDLTVRVESRDEEAMLTLALETDDPWGAIDRHGQVPLPPYMRRAPEVFDRERYQTVFARNPGAVAAPTAGLHLTEAILADLEAKGVARASVTLHVGPGTFLPVTVDDLDQHPMHAEWYDIPARSAEIVRGAKQSGGAVVAVGTTVVRTLESWGGDGALQGDTRLLIQPGSTFRVVDRLLTNFHLPRSTLLALVMAFAGEELTRRAYREAVAERYRFFSYGDAMFITE
jgi:S-adenosylmethionine:tRNA ribosyltransferase-isomerase